MDFTHATSKIWKKGEVVRSRVFFEFGGCGFLKRQFESKFHRKGFYHYIGYQINYSA